jgi:hypothetical protein
MIVTKQKVVAALAQQRVNRPRALADQNIRSILRTYGGGANSIGELSPELYFHVFVAAGGMGSVCAPIQREQEPWDVIEDAPSASRARIRSPMVADLEARLAATKAKTRRSVPGGRVDVGAPTHFGDQTDDVVRDFPAGERVR